MKTILFQGDSITDAGRSSDNISFIGVGYAQLVTAELLTTEVGECTCINRGISGNRSIDLYARVKIDIINLKPDVLSILIGTNDVWHEIKRQNGISPDKFYKIYSMLIEEVKEALPDVKIMIMEPFVLEGEATKDNIDEFRKGIAEMGVRAKKIADTYGLPFIPLQNVFDEACKKAPADYWLIDGVHPTPAGHGLIKNEWLKAYKNI